MNQLNSISPIDGRYYDRTIDLQKYFSEMSLMKYRLHIEVEYFIFLSENNFFELSSYYISQLRDIVTNFSITDANKIKDIELITNHDVKSIEYFLKEKINDISPKLVEWVHFGLTSQDINNTAIPLLIKDFINETYINNIFDVKNRLFEIAHKYKDISMLARTHGQPASPTTLGKEIMVFVERIENQILQLNNIPFTGKFGGATGNLNAHYVAYPSFNWVNFSNVFLNKIGIERNQFTTQIEHYDNLSALFDCCKRINNILIDLCRDIWQYISIEYFKQTIKEGEVGSSAMPHKVNPIDFENAEGNLCISNSNFEFLSSKLPISRLQRDLTDSTVLRNVGVPFSHTIIAFKSIMKGLSKLEINNIKIDSDLDTNWSVISEAIQTILRREGYHNPYDELKKLTRGNIINKDSIHKFINELDCNEELKKELMKITPYNYIGNSSNF